MQTIRRKSDERGSVLILMVLFLPVIALMMTFVVDVGNWYVHSRHLQAQADAAALAGAGSMDVSSGCNASTIASVIRQYGGDPGTSGTYNAQKGPSGNVSIRINSTSYSDQGGVDYSDGGNPCQANYIDIKVTEQSVPLFFGGMVPGISPTVHAHARVSFQSVRTSQIIPVAVENPSPSYVRAEFYNLDTNDILATDVLQKTGTTTGSNGLPYDIFDSVSSPASVSVVNRTGVRIVASGGSNTQCGQALVQCYDQALFIHGYIIPTTTNGATQISAGGFHTCAVYADKTVWCWGNNINGQLGNNTTTQSTKPVQVKGVGGSGYLAGVSQISAGTWHTCALLTSGSVYCWGNNVYGQLGDNTTTTRKTPVQVKGVGGSGYLTGVSQISSGGYHTCAVLTSGSVYCWGYNNNGQLGDNTTTTRKTPVQVKGVGGSGYLGGAKQVGAGGYHTCAVTGSGASGGIYCWGDNAYGQLGNSSNTDSSTPIVVFNINPSSSHYPIEVAGGAYHTCAQFSDGGVWCWGRGNYYQTGRSGQQSVPVQINNFTGADVSTGEYHTCAVTPAGSAYCWGHNDQGQLGNGNNNDSDSSTDPFQVKGVGGSGYLSGVSQISAGGANDGSSHDYNHSCALLSSGAINCWGNNTYGQLGNNSTTNSNTPVAVSGVSGNGGPAYPWLEDTNIAAGSCPDAYFNYQVTGSSCDLGLLTATIDFGVTDPVSTYGATVTATIDGGTHDGATYSMTAGSSGSKLWSGDLPTISGDDGPVTVDLTWKLSKGTFNGVSSCTTTKTGCYGTFTVVQQSYGAGFSTTRTLQSADLINPANGNSGYESMTLGTHQVVVSINFLSYQQNAVSVSEPLVSLRVSDGKNSSIDCDPNVANTQTEIEQGCAPTYRVDTNPTVDCAVTANSTQPWPCVKLKASDPPAQIAQGMNNRILAGGSCSQHPNNWGAFPNLVLSDTRQIITFLIPFAGLNSPAGTYLPIQGFAAFYTTGWGTPNCAGNDPAPNGWIVGHFMKVLNQLDTTGDAIVSCSPSDRTKLNPCTAVLTQ